MNGFKVVIFISFSVCFAYADVVGFAYGVSDGKTGDLKDQQETRDGDTVSGYYRVNDPDGFVRTVYYKADPVNGFSADVKREKSSKSALPSIPKPDLPTMESTPVFQPTEPTMKLTNYNDAHQFNAWQQQPIVPSWAQTDFYRQHKLPFKNTPTNYNALPDSNVNQQSSPSTFYSSLY
ncbi:pupal cuticle protein Edg-84A-like [Daktulosphaira vitifoliae]|uniref:pupal cuticle protein Edg-84A-like n=1 Tax=Daktulosphaira vitifoliae TaxID=58002 RepID=UPI0021AABF23|nr:pupal cuticle protein Edg-84A-like [Daktulosphaira vitifoliae]